MVYGWCEGAEWGFFVPLYSLAGPQNRSYFDLSDSFRGGLLGNSGLNALFSLGLWQHKELPNSPQGRAFHSRLGIQRLP